MYNLTEYPHVFKNIGTDYLEKVTQQGFMFARKFPSSLQVTANGKRVQLRDLLPKLWEKVDAKVAQQRVWSRISSAGLPANTSHKVTASLPRTLASLAQHALASSQTDRLEVHKVGLRDSVVNDVEVHNLGVTGVGVRNVSLEGSAELKQLQIHRADLNGSASVDSLHMRNWTMENVQLGSVDFVAEITKVSKLARKVDSVVTSSLEVKDDLIGDLKVIFLLVKLVLAVFVVRGIVDLLRGFSCCSPSKGLKRDQRVERFTIFSDEERAETFRSAPTQPTLASSHLDHRQRQ